MINKIKCFFGWHLWVWKFERGDTLDLGGNVPLKAACKNCGCKNT